MFLVASSNDKFDRSKIEQIYLDEWFSQYIGTQDTFSMSLKFLFLNNIFCNYKRVTRKI